MVVVSTKAGQMDTLQAKMSISGRRGQGKSEAGGSLTHCALKRFITPYFLKFRKGVICKVALIQARQAACSVLLKRDWLMKQR